MTVVKYIAAVSGGLTVTADYTNISAWESFLNGVGAMADDYAGRVLWKSAGHELSTASGLTFDGSTPGAFQIYLEAGDASGSALASFRDHPSATTNPLRYNKSVGACITVNSGTSDAITISDPNVNFRYLQFVKSTAAHGIVKVGTDSGVIIDSCIFCVSTGTAYSQDTLLVRGVTVKNSVFYISTSKSGDMRHVHDQSLAANRLFLYNNTFANTRGSAGVTIAQRKQYSNSIWDVRNNVFYGFASAYVGDTTSLTFTNNATDFTASSVFPAGTSTNQYAVVGATEFVSVTTGSEDFRLTTAGTKLTGQGTQSGMPTVDIIGQTRS